MPVFCFGLTGDRPKYEEYAGMGDVQSWVTLRLSFHVQNPQFLAVCLSKFWFICYSESVLD